LNEAWLPVLASFVGGGLVAAVLKFITDKRSSDVQANKDAMAADADRIELMYRGFDRIIKEAKDALNACVANLEKCEESSRSNLEISHALGETVVDLSQKVRVMTAFVESLENHVQAKEVGDEPAGP
jgi:hypothetical protein